MFHGRGMASVWFSWSGVATALSPSKRGELGLQYNYKEAAVYVLQCRDLAAVDSKGTDPIRDGLGVIRLVMDQLDDGPVDDGPVGDGPVGVDQWMMDQLVMDQLVMDQLGDGPVGDGPVGDGPMEPLEDLIYSLRGDLILALKFVPPDAVSSKKTRRFGRFTCLLVAEHVSTIALIDKLLLSWDHSRVSSIAEVK
ncbi:putative Synaptotagmin-like, partial [Homarus americanus]